MEVEGRGYYPVLDGMRGLVALAVVVYHYLGAVGWLDGVPRGYLGVDFFFLLSGFVIEAAYALRLSAGGFLGGFAIQRVIRLWPMIFAGALFGWAVSFYDASSTGLDALLCAFVLPHLAVAGIAYPTNSPTWSLFFELFANALYAVALVRVRNLVLVAFVTASGVVLAALTLHLHKFNVGFNATNFVGGFPRVLFSLFLGVLLRRWLSSGKLPLGGPASCAALVLCLAVPIMPSYNDVIDLALVAIAFPLIVLAGARGPATPRWTSVCRWAGEISYPLYLLHFPLVAFLKPLAGSSPALKIGAVTAMSVAALVLSGVVLNLYDRPVRTLLAKFARRKAYTPVHAR